MPFGLNAGYGVRRLIDSYENLVRASHPVYIRLRNFAPVESNEWSQLGFSISPTGNSNTDGTEDILIAPQPAVTVISVQSIGQSMGKLRFGARQFLISHTFVVNQFAAMGLTGTPDLVWRGEQTVGLVTDSQEFSIEDIQHEEAFGETITWVLLCNAAETG
jgi:hypothetical protein